MAPRKRPPARPRPTPRGVRGKRTVLYLDPLAQRHLPLDLLNACLDRHRKGQGRQKFDSPRFTEPVTRSHCRHAGFDWWIVEFPKQRRIFVGPPEFFRTFFR